VPLVYLASDVYPILLANCGMTCHSSGTATNGNLDLGSGFGYLGISDELQNKTGNNPPDTACNEDLVFMEDPAQSLLYQKISGVGIPAGCGVQMPKGGPYLSAADQETIKDWILDGEPLSK
jgi:hypothetical protein